MKQFGIIGYPAAHSLSPILFKEAYGGAFGYDIIETSSFDHAFGLFLKYYDAVNLTMPFKGLAAERADFRSEAVQATGAANILVKEADGIHAYNSDYLAVKKILESNNCDSCSIIGIGGAGKAALFAAEELGLDVRTYHHDEIADGVEADTVIFTLPKAVPGIERIRCRVLLEANYKDPCLQGIDGIRDYIPGKEWLKFQAIEGYALMTGIVPDIEKILYIAEQF